MRAASKVGVMYSSPDLREPDDIGINCSLHSACYWNKSLVDPGFQRGSANPLFWAENILFDKVFAENCIKMKDGRAFLVLPFD